MLTNALASPTKRADGGCAAEVFEHGDTGARVVNVFDHNVPVEAIEWLLVEAKARL